MKLNKLFQWTAVMFFTLGVGMLLTCNQVSAATLNVPTEYASIQASIDDAAYGDIVLVDDGIYTENINFDGKAITVRSQNGAATTTIDGNANGSVVTFASGETASSVLDGFTITNGSGTNVNNDMIGGGIYCKDSSPTITNCNIINNLKSYGSGIYVGWESAAMISHCIINDNLGQGIACSGSTATISHCAINNNSQGLWINGASVIVRNCTINYNAVGIFAYGMLPAPEIVDCDISFNRGGGGIYYHDVGGTITNCNISNNGGRGIHLRWSPPTITGCTINNNSGGGIYIRDVSRTTIENCEIKNNSITGDDTKGGGIFFDTASYISPIIKNCSIIGNSATSGGGIYAYDDAQPIITDTRISSNIASYEGGGFYCEPSRNSNGYVPTIKNSAIVNNTASVGGGIALHACNIAVSNTSISHNSGGTGAGIFMSGSSSTFTNCTISYNSGGSMGGGMYGYDVYPHITNCLIHNNTAYDGGGINCSESAPIIVNSTIADNTASNAGGGIYSYYSPVTITNSILWGNSENIHLRGLGSAAIVSYSDVEGGDPDNPGSPYLGTGNINKNPLFIDNGDYQLRKNSPCVDTGTLTDAPPDDIEGGIRPQGNGIDMGAYEFSLLGTISGFITTTNYSPLANALVKLRRNNITIEETYTTSKGHYEFRNVDQSGYGVVASKKGFKNNWALGFVSPNRKWSKNEFINLTLTPRN